MKKLTGMLLSLALLGGCVDEERSIRALEEAERQMTDAPDSALMTLKSLDRRTLHTRKRGARYALLYTQALDKNCVEAECDTLMSTAMRYYQYRGPKRERALAYFYSERAYESRQEIDSAIIQIQEAEKFAKQTDDLYLKGLIANTYAILYESQNFVEQAKDKYLEAADYFSQVGHKKNLLKNYMGAIYNFSILKNHKAQIYYHNLAEKLAIDLKDTLMLSSLIHYQVIRIMEEDSNYKNALRALRDASIRYYHGNIHPSYNLTISQIYTKLNKPDSALIYLQPLINQTENFQTRDRLEIMYIAGIAMKQQNKYKEAYKYNYEALAISDTLYFQEKEKSIPALKEKYKADQLALQNQHLEETRRYMFCIATVLVLMILFISLWLSSRRKRLMLLQEQKITDYRHTISRLKSEYETLRSSRKTEHPAIAPEIVERRIAFLKQILDTTAHYNHDKELFYTKIEQLLTQHGAKPSQKGANEMFLLFQDILNDRHPGVIDRLCEAYPQLTAQELGMYSMICLEMSKSAICLVLGIRLKTYYNYRNILRSKLKMINEEMTIPQHFDLFCQRQLLAEGA